MAVRSWCLRGNSQSRNGAAAFTKTAFGNRPKFTSRKEEEGKRWQGLEENQESCSLFPSPKEMQACRLVPADPGQGPPVGFQVEILHALYHPRSRWGLFGHLLTPTPRKERKRNRQGETPSSQPL